MKRLEICMNVLMELIEHKRVSSLSTWHRECSCHTHLFMCNNLPMTMAKSAG